MLCFETPSSTEWAAAFPGGLPPERVRRHRVDAQHKLEAMSPYAHTHVSEVRAYPHPRSLEALEVYARRHGIKVGVDAAEPFVLVRQNAR